MNNYPDDFNISSDYATISATGGSIMSFTLPGGISIASNTVYFQKQEINMTNVGILRLLVSTSTNPDRAITASKIDFVRTFAVSGGGTTPTSVLISGWRESKNKIVCALSIFNPYDTAIINQNATETFYIDVRTMTFPY
jgi:hypothetical protein